MVNTSNYISDLPGAVLTTNSRGKITSCSISLVKHLKYNSSEEIIGRSLKFIFEKGKLPNIKNGLVYFHENTEYRIATINCVTLSGAIVPADFFIPTAKTSWWKNSQLFILTGSPFSVFTRSKELVYTIFKQARKAKHLNQLLEFIYMQLTELIDTRNFYIALYNDETDKYTFPIYHDEFDLYESWKPVEMKDSITDFVRKSSRSLMLTDQIRTEYMTKHEMKPQGTLSRQWLGVPLLNSQKKASGVIAVQSYRENDLYTRSDLELLEFVAGNIGATIDKIRYEEEHKRLNLIVEQSEDLIATITSEGALTYINKAGLKLLGINSIKDLSTNVFDHFLSRSEQDVIFAELTSRGLWRGNLTIPSQKNQDKIEVSVTISSIIETASPYPYYSVTMKDLSDSIANEQKRKSLEEQLFHARKMEAIGTLAGGIAHDFNNILGAIIGFAELASDKSNSAKSPVVYMGKIIKASERARDMTKQILAFSRKTRIEYKPVRMEEIIRETVKLLKNTIPSNIKFRSRIRKISSPVKGDPAQMMQVIMNICTNASHAMKKTGGIINISLKEDHSSINEMKYLELKIKDTGEGMNAKTLSRVFEPYFTTKSLGEGTGMGLAVVHGIIVNHDGRIQINSSPGEGTEVKILLPQMSLCSLEQTGKDMNRSQQKSMGHILLIEDEEFLLEIVKQHLETSGFIVTSFESGRDGLAYFVNNRASIDLILTDQTLPDTSGTDIIKEALKIIPSLPSIITTGYNSLVNESNYTEFGATQFLMKPFNKKELLETINNALQKR